jgi:hypothetical protein
VVSKVHSQFCGAVKGTVEFVGDVGFTYGTAAL